MSHSSIPLPNPFGAAVSAGRARGNSPLHVVFAWMLLLAGAGVATADEPSRPQGSPPVFQSGWTVALEAAAEDRALILVVFEADWCVPCQALKRDTLGSEEFRRQGGPLHVVTVNADHNERMTRQFGPRALPDLVLVTDDGKIVSRRQGYLTTETLLAWLEQGRRRAEQGVWEGLAWGDEADIVLPMLERADPAEVERRLAELMGATDAGVRARVVRTLVGSREEIMPVLVKLADHEYLGVRLTAVETLEKLAPQAPVVDPWAGPAERAATVSALQQWWAETGRLPPPEIREAFDPTAVTHLKRALELMASNDPTQRTRAMTTVVGLGSGALPRVREAIQRAERQGDHRLVSLLEEVRWTILLPDEVESRLRGARATLSRGASPERQAMARQLAAAGPAALPALGELVDDADPLVKENALTALAGLGGDEAIVAMATLLRSANSNLRMTAAQSLGKTNNRSAAPHLVRALDDPNEVVVCAAIAALEELGAKEAGPALVRCLSDTRWRVRAAAAAAVGKLQVPAALDDLRALLGDADGFVVKTAITSLKQLGAAPGLAEVRPLVARLPELAALVVEMLIYSDTPSALETIGSLYRENNDNQRAEILRVLAKQHNQAQTDDRHWKPLLTEATRSPNPHLRVAAAEVLMGRSASLAAELIGSLLDDAEREVRRAAARVVLRLAAHHWGVGERQRGRDARILAWLHDPAAAAAAVAGDEEEEPVVEADALAPEANVPPAEVTAETRRQRKLQRAQEVAGLHAAWHQALQRHANEPMDFHERVALYVTGDGRVALSVLQQAIEQLASDKLERPADYDEAAATLLRRLPWPEGQPVVEAMSRAKPLVAPLLRGLTVADPTVGAHVLEVERFVAMIEAAVVDHPRVESVVAELLATIDFDGLRARGPIVIGERAIPIGPEVYRRLLQSKNPLLRAVAAYMLADEAVLALQDPDPWVRRAAAHGVALRTADHARRQELLAPLLRDSDAEVVVVAVAGLLELEVRRAAYMSGVLQRFRVGSVNQYLHDAVPSASSDDDRPLRPLPEQPAWLETARERLARVGDGEEELRTGLALLLAQHGDFRGLDGLAARWKPGKEQRGGTAALLAGIALSRDPKYVPLLRQMTDAASGEWELRRLLQALRGMSGVQARALRLEINRRIAGLEP
jgi:HEAT repeat protein/thiol-disulfide isomerase/thioredoxin